MMTMPHAKPLNHSMIQSTTAVNLKSTKRSHVKALVAVEEAATVAVEEVATAVVAVEEAAPVVVAEVEVAVAAVAVVVDATDSCDLFDAKMKRKAKEKIAFLQEQ
jgi:hypothetical protein